MEYMGWICCAFMRSSPLELLASMSAASLWRSIICFMALPPLLLQFVDSWLLRKITYEGDFLVGLVLFCCSC